MAAEDDIKRIVIEVSGDEVSHREMSKEEFEKGLKEVKENAASDLKKRMDEVAGQMKRGEHAEPILPTGDSVVDSVAELTDSLDDLAFLYGDRKSVV